MSNMNQAHDLTDLILGGELLATDPDVTDPQDFVKQVEARVATMTGHHALAVVSAPRDALPALGNDASRPLRMFFSTIDDPVVDQARDYLARLMPEHVQMPQPAVLMQMLRNAKLRVAFLETHESWNASQVAQFAGSTAKNSSALAGRWRSEGQVFAVDLDNELLYPAFQFDPATRKPKPVMSRLLAVFGERGASPWEVALWMTSPRSGLDGVPLEGLDTAADAVVEAAERTYRPVL